MLVLPVLIYSVRPAVPTAGRTPPGLKTGTRTGRSIMLAKNFLVIFRKALPLTLLTILSSSFTRSSGRRLAEYRSVINFVVSCDFAITYRLDKLTRRCYIVGEVQRRCILALSTPVEKTCIVCGLKSHRADWASKTNPACDSHTGEEIQSALAKTRQSPSPAPAKSKAASAPMPED